MVAVSFAKDQLGLLMVWQGVHQYRLNGAPDLFQAHILVGTREAFSLPIRNQPELFERLAWAHRSEKRRKFMERLDALVLLYPLSQASNRPG